MRRNPSLVLLFALTVLVVQTALSSDIPTKKVLVVVEGSSSLKNPAMGDGRQLAALLGHFHTAVTAVGVNDYAPHSLDGYDFTFYVGFHHNNSVPAKFLEDVLATKRPVIWLNTGFAEFASQYDVRGRYGFTVTRFDTTSVFDQVKSEGKTFTKGEPNINIVAVTARQRVTVLATALSTAAKKETPYIVHSGNLLYVADSPFASATETDRYLLFADMLHDILGEQHEESHNALIRIEDVTPMENPDHLREIADILSARDIPFLISVVPFYVNPGEGVRVSLSDKPDVVDALKYMVQNGGTIVMHGVTHQYKGITASDYEFWDENSNGVIKGETAEAIDRKLDTGLEEFMRNGLYPLLWETPHYTASNLLYETVARHFSSAMEQRLSIENFDYSQFFPYIIEHDLYGQRIYPENLGYVPLDSDPARNAATIRSLLRGAQANLAVRDGFASCFFHAFVDLDLLKDVVDGIRNLGYTYMDLREQTHWVRANERIILCGTQEYTLALSGQYLVEATYSRDGELLNKVTSPERITGSVTRTVRLEPGEFYRAEPTELRERPLSFVESLLLQFNNFSKHFLSEKETWHAARPAILWNHHARGAAYNDQASLAAVFNSVGVSVDTIFAGQHINLTGYNLLIVPQTFVDSLQHTDYDIITKFVHDGGSLITDGKNDLAEELGVRFGAIRTKISRVRDNTFPEERISWRYSELLTRFEADRYDEIFCSDELTEAPLIVGFPYGKGRIIFIGTTFDPHSALGVSQYPFLMDYVRRYFRLGPSLRRDDLEVYFDPGFRRTISTEQLVKQWVAQGIRVIHVAGWHEYPKYTYDYTRLISLAHANGILTYIWIEPPQVSQKFWLEHPEWREKNYKGEDVRPSWRYPVALTDPRCLEQMIQNYRRLLESYDWDGVNLGELYFEAGRGFEDPQLYTPMHPSAREAYRKLYGYDPAAILTPSSPFFWKENPAARHALTTFRVDAVYQVYEQILAMLEDVGRTKTGFEIVVTAMDSYGSPELRENIAVDMTSILALQRAHGFTLQVEDPEHLWSTSPLRYLDIGRRYAGLIQDSSKLMLDLNILSFRRPDQVTPFPTLIQTGTESFQLVRAAAMGAPRMTIYAESSINPQDLVFLPYVLTGNIQYRSTDDGCEVTSPSSFTLKLSVDREGILIDGAPLAPSRDNVFLIPAGEHRIRFGMGRGDISVPALQPRILSLTGNLLSATYSMRTITFNYSSPRRTLVSINHEPTQVLVDGEALSFRAMKGNDCYSIYLPPGNHAVELTAGNPFSYGISLTSFWSTTAIALFGSVAVALLLGMYLVLVVVRRRQRRVLQV